MQDIILRDLISYLKEYKNIKKIIFTGKNSKNGPEFFFRKLIKKNNLKLQKIENNQIRKHLLSFENRVITIYSLTSPSNAANRSIATNLLYKKRKMSNYNYSTFDFRVDEYKIAFS